MQDLKQVAKSALIFSLAGPLIGHLAFVTFLFALQLLMSSDSSLSARLATWSLMAGGGLFFAYLFGFVPAIATGALYSAVFWLKPRLVSMRRVYRAIFAAILGAACTFVFYAHVGIDASWRSGLAFAPYGAVAAFVLGCFWPRRTEELSNHSFNGDVAKATHH
jgi:hypothetical protein